MGKQIGIDSTEKTEASNPGKTESATFGAGCFWCLDAVARRIAGITSSVVGYAGGEGPPPTYQDIHYSDRARGFIEAVRLTFDPSVISYDDIVDLFFQSHDPTTPNQDGANYGPAYHSTIFYESDVQRDTAKQAIEALSAKLGKQVVTTLRPFTVFYEAENEHQNFFDRNPRSAYCRVIIEPKLKKLDLLRRDKAAGSELEVRRFRGKW